jgi:hypothetical protein
MLACLVDTSMSSGADMILYSQRPIPEGGFSNMTLFLEVSGHRAG